MARSLSSSRRPNASMPVMVLGLVLLSLLPARWIGFIGWFGGVAQTLLAPIEGPVSTAVRSLRGPARLDDETDPRLREITAELERTRLLRLQAEDENRRLRERIVGMQRGIDLNPALDIRQFVASVINLQPDPSGTLLKIRAGAAQGVTTDAVAVFEDVHLIGRVVSTDNLISYVLPIVDRASGVQDAAIMIDEGGSAGEGLASAVRCSLTPTTEGRLAGPVEYQPVRPGMVAPEIKPGQIVRLVGSQWPPAARLLVVGRVERVDMATNQRPMVTVKPVYDLRALGEVIVRFNGSPDSSARPGGAGGAP